MTHGFIHNFIHSRPFWRPNFSSTSNLYYYAFNLTLTIPSKPVRDWIWAGVDSNWRRRRSSAVSTAVHGIEVVVAEGVPPHLPPDPFLGVAWGAVRRQPVHGDVGRHQQRLRLMPAGTVYKHQAVFVGMPPGHLGQAKGPARGVGVR